VKEYLSTKGISYLDHDVSTNIEKGKEMIMKTRHLGIPIRQLGVPIITIDDEVILGFNKTRLDEIFPT